MNISKFIALAFLLIFSSCSDYFELERPPQDPWTSPDDFDAAAVGVYSSLFSSNKWVNPYINWHVVQSAMGDDVGNVNTLEYGWDRDTKQLLNYNDRNIRLLYRTVGACNNALDFVKEKNGDPYPSEPDSIKTNKVNRIIGELYFIRGFAYYLLQTTFGHTIDPNGSNADIDIPIPTSYPKDITNAKNPEIGTTLKVWNLITSDLKKAKELLPEKYIAGVMPEVYQARADKYAASAMLARVYFQKAKYDSALAECNFIISAEGGTRFALEDPIQAFNKTTFAAKGKEVIFYIPFSNPNLPAPQHLSTENHTFIDEVANPPVLCTFTQNYMTSAVLKDIGWMASPLTSDTAMTEAAWRDKRFKTLFARRYPTTYADKPHDSRLKKNGFPLELKDVTTVWSNKFFRGNGVVGSMYTNLPVIRLAEIYLTRATCILKTSGDATAAAADYNIVARRAWIKDLPPPFGSKDYVDKLTVNQADVNKQRLIELFNEADRVTYLRGLKVPIPKGERDGDGDSDNPADADAFSSENFVWGIPNRETAYNEALSGN